MFPGERDVKLLLPTSRERGIKMVITIWMVGCDSAPNDPAKASPALAQQEQQVVRVNVLPVAAAPTVVPTFFSAFHACHKLREFMELIFVGVPGQQKAAHITVSD